MLSRGKPMKRTGFAPRAPVQAAERVRAPLVLVPIRVPTPTMPAVFSPVVKLNPLRSEPYRRFVASHACFECGLVGSSQCAHANEGKGMAMKVCDRRSFPLCFPCHAAFDQSRGMTREDRRAKEARYVDRMQTIARAAGRPEIPP